MEGNMVVKTTKIFVSIMVLFVSAMSLAIVPEKGSFYANATKFELDPKLPEPFSRTQTAQVIVNYDQQDVSLIFLMSDSEGIDVTFPMISVKKDACGVKEIVAAPPAGSTPYYKDFEIKVIDYSEKTCEQVQAPAPTFASLKSFEVRHQATTYSTIHAESLQPSPNEGH